MGDRWDRGNWRRHDWRRHAARAGLAHGRGGATATGAIEIATAGATIAVESVVIAIGRKLAELDVMFAGKSGGAGGGREGPVRKNEVTTYEDFKDRSVVGDNLEAHEVWQHANQKARGLTDKRLGTEASKANPVIALESETHASVSAAQRMIDASTQTPIENIRANMEILRELRVAPANILEQLERLAIEHARLLGY